MASTSTTPKPYLAPLAIPPGDTIREMLSDRGMTQRELALRMGRPPQVVNEIIQGRKAITPETAVQLETVIGLNRDYWLTRQRSYEEAQRRIAEQRRKEQEEVRIKQDASRLAEFPYAELSKRGYVKTTRKKRERVLELRQFLQVASFDALDEYIDSFPMAARLAQTSSLTRAKLAVWLRIAQQQTEDHGWSPGKFRKADLRRQLPEMRRLSRETSETVFAELQDLALDSGLVLLFVREFKGFPTKGMTVWLRDNPYILLTLHGKRHDALWFSLFHEIGHVLLHDRRIIIEGRGILEDEHIEKEADQFARDTLIPPSDFARLLEQPITPFAIQRFSESIDLDPGIVLGRLQHEGYIDWGDPRFAVFRRSVHWVEPT